MTSLGVPFNATTEWLIHELERRHLVLPARGRALLGYMLILSPGDGALSRHLQRHESLARAGLCNNSTLHVRVCVRAGMQGMLIRSLSVRTLFY